MKTPHFHGNELMIIVETSVVTSHPFACVKKAATAVFYPVKKKLEKIYLI